LPADVPDGSFVSVEQGRGEDGSAYVKIEISSRDGKDGGDTDDNIIDIAASQAQAGQDGSGEGPRESRELAPGEVDEDQIRTIDDLAASVGMTPAQLQQELEAGPAAADGGYPSSSSNNVEDFTDGDEAARLAAWRADAGGEGSDRRRSLKEEVEAMTEALLRSSGGGGYPDSDGAWRGVCWGKEFGVWPPGMCIISF
jgi:hypothetical protein